MHYTGKNIERDREHDERKEDRCIFREDPLHVRIRAEPKASTCTENLYDTGNGFFTALDGNADGRVSEREKRTDMPPLRPPAFYQLPRAGQPAR